MMKRVVVEDSSLSFTTDQETGQYLVSGLGELHLEILRDRLKTNGFSVRMGNVKISFKETIGKIIVKSMKVKN
jgi:elongation factor G